MSIEFKDNSIEVKNRLNNMCIAWLYEAAGELTSQTQRNSKVDSGQTKGAWKYVVDDSKQTATIGNPLENAIYEEFGTGEYALNGGGRKGWWVYVEGNATHSRSQHQYTEDEARKVVAFLRSKGLKAHMTKGKHPRRMLHKAHTALKKPIQQALENKLKEGMK